MIIKKRRKNIDRSRNKINKFIEEWFEIEIEYEIIINDYEYKNTNFVFHENKNDRNPQRNKNIIQFIFLLNKVVNTGCERRL